MFAEISKQRAQVALTGIHLIIQAQAVLNDTFSGTYEEMYEVIVYKSIADIRKHQNCSNYINE